MPAATKAIAVGWSGASTSWTGPGDLVGVLLALVAAVLYAVGATSWLVLAEVPAGLARAGGATCLLGVAVATGRFRRRDRRAEALPAAGRWPPSPARSTGRRPAR